MESLSPREPAIYPAVYAGVALLLISLVLASEQVYLLDLGGWVYQGAAAAKLVAGREAGRYAFQPYPVPNAFATVFFALTVPLLGAYGAGKAFVALYLAAAFGTAYALGLASDAGTAARRAAVIAATLFVSSSFWNGYLDFQIGLVVAAVFIALWLRRGRPRPLVIVGFSVLLFFTHAIPFAVVVLTVGLDALRRRDLARLAALGPSAVLTVWYVAGRTAASGYAPTVYAPAHFFDALLYKGYTVLKLGPFQHVVGLNGRGFLEAVPVLYWVLLSLSAVFVAALTLGVAWRLGRGGHYPVIIYGVVLFLLALLLPSFALNVINPGERVAACAALLILSLVRLPQRLLTGLAIAALAFLTYDAGYLATRLSGLSPDTRFQLYIARVESAGRDRMADPDGHVEAFRDPQAFAADSLYPASQLPYLNHAVYFTVPLYEATARGDFSLPSYNSGLLTERRLAP